MLTLFKYNPEKPLIFTSVSFFILFGIFYLMYSAVFTKIKLRNMLLLCFSLFFYYKLSGAYVFLLVFMASSDYLLGLAIFRSASEKRKKIFFLTSIFINIGSLIGLKYTKFIVDSWMGFTSSDQSPLLANIIFPIGISFFVFKSLTYIFDLYREAIDKPETNYINYLLYLSFFPNILAGPIAKAKDLLPQFRLLQIIDKETINKALFLIISGLLKKCVISDYIGSNFVDRVFDAPQYFTGFENFMAGYGAILQIYTDFSGYTDIVLGIALLLGFTVSQNFNQPFIAKNITDFWRRWHITLSRWLNDYLFYPLSYSFRRAKIIGVVAAILLTFIVSGLWHGSNWTFIVWGLVHGIALSWDKITETSRAKIRKIISVKIYNTISIFLTFHFVVFSVILFKSANLSIATEIYKKIFSDFNLSLALQWISLYTAPFILIFIGFTLHFTKQYWESKISFWFSNTVWWAQSLVIALCLIVIYQFSMADSLPFVYLSF